MMRLKLFIILLLLFAIFTSAAVGTLSNYTISIKTISSGELTAEVIITESMLMPDYSQLPSGVDYLQGIIHNTTHVRNTHGFVAVTGNLTQDGKNSAAIIGHKNNDAHPVYLIYFEPGTSLYLDNGKTAYLSGFYKISAGQDLFDENLYIQNGSGFTLNPEATQMTVCNNVSETCSLYNIPLTLRK
jgi:hypothetical protein